MSDRDWEKELAEIDRKLGSIPDEAPPPNKSAPPPPAKGRSAVAVRDAAPAPAARVPGAPVEKRHWKATAGLLIRMLLTGLLLAVVVVWPYETRCGPWLAAYLGTIAATALGAIWTAIAAWRHRAGFVHLVGLLMFLAAGVAAGLEILPRIGYAMPDPAHPAIWACR